MIEISSDGAIEKTDPWLIDVLALIAPSGLERVHLAFRRWKKPYVGGAAWLRGTPPYAVIRTPEKPVVTTYPAPHPNRFNGKPGWTVELRSLEEQLVYAIGHELGHLRFGASERPAHACGMRGLRRYRRTRAKRSAHHVGGVR